MNFRTRSAFMTGYYPHHIGTQDSVIFFLDPDGVPLRFQLLPEQFKKLGYRTHMVGKWHLGFCAWEYTPLHRGFDTFYGFYQGSEDHWTHFVSK